MKTIFLNGVMLDRCAVFVNRLARRYRVAAPGLSSGDPALNLMDSLAVAGPPTDAQKADTARRMEEQTSALAASLADDLTAVAPSFAPGWQVPRAMVQQDLQPRVEKILGDELAFRNFVARQPVDLVISGSDYSSHSRVTAMVAREMGIPTLNLEHGFFFMRFRYQGEGPRGVLPTVFTSEYANLDNPLEVDVFRQRAAAVPHLSTRYLALGTPVATVAGTPLDPARARQTLELTGERKRVLVLGSWIEARAVHSMVQGQLDMMDLYEDLLGSLGQSELGREVELLIKVHPVEGHPQVFPGVRAALLRMAERHGLPAPRVFNDRLPELLTVCDTVVSLGFSSVLFEAFQLEKPSIVMVPRFLQPTHVEGWQTSICAPLEEKVVAVADDGAMACALVAASLEPGAREQHAAAVARFKQRHGLNFPSVEQKSEAIIDWIDDLLAGQETSGCNQASD